MLARQPQSLGVRTRTGVPEDTGERPPVEPQDTDLEPWRGERMSDRVNAALSAEKRVSV
jgi:hypothetical protein